jgi:hypothetical protein
MLYPVDGGQPRELTRFPDASAVAVVMWARDGKSVFLRTVEGERIDFWRLPVESGTPQKLDSPALPGPFLLSPDGRHVAYQPPQSARKPAEVWVMENLFPKNAGK